MERKKTRLNESEMKVMFVYLIEHFLRDLDRFVIYGDDHTVHSGGNGSGNR